MKNRNYALDAVRMCAILPVLVVHWGTFALKNPPIIMFALGGLGVELFFALSGFLIGGIILRDFDRGFSWPVMRNFWVRRWMRTIPLYWTAFVATIFVTIWGLKVDPMFSAKCLAYVVFLQNLAWPMVDWFQESWSLAIEEWFYLLFPLLFAVMPGTSARRRVLYVAIALATVPLVLRISTYDLAHEYDLYVRRIAVLRLDAIAFGILGALAVRSFDLRRYTRLIGAAGWAGSIAVVLVMTGAWAHDGFFLRTFALTLTSASFAALVVWASYLKVPYSALVHWFSTRSYALYLVNGCVLRTMIHHGWFDRTPIVSLAIYSAGCVGLAEAAHRLIEQPFMRRRPKELHTLPHAAGSDNSSGSQSARAEVRPRCQINSG